MTARRPTKRKAKKKAGPSRASASEITAYEAGESRDMPIVPAAKEREWMDAFDDGFPYRCLPLVVANQSGWVILNPISFTARWNGGARIKDTRLWFPRGKRDPRVLSHFGAGVITFTLPYLFRTPPGINLWVKGPANRIKDGVQPLEGIVESDWTEASFTMNWKVTRPDAPIRFEQGEPICMLVPVPRGLVENLVPVREPLTNNAELHDRHKEWGERRLEFNLALKRRDAEAVKRGWQRDYMLGLDLEGNHFDEHQTNLHVRPFAKRKPKKNR